MAEIKTGCVRGIDIRGFIELGILISPQVELKFKHGLLDV